MQQHAAELSKELDRRAETIKWLESQVSKIRQESLDREADLSRRFSNKEAGMKVEMETVAQERASLCNKEKAAKQQVSNLKRHHQAELSRVEVRVKETLLAKDAKINTLQEEINGKQAEIENLKRTLLKHKQELDI
ncbi:hypothetical protein BSKO_11159 [Bryopsis sp. KO-2023]|nr:hypothetical protein BSKO_11159 [Bryopsis sp. KO-2023]